MAEKELIAKLGVDADLATLEKYRDLMNSVLGTYEENIKNLTTLNQEIKRYQGTISDLNQVEAKNRALTEDEIQEREIATKTVRNLQTAKSELLQTIKEQEKFMRAENEEYKRTNSVVGLLSQTYRKMSKEQRAANQDLAKDINTLRDSLKAADASIGNFQRNVGNYPQLLQQVTAQIPGLNGVAGAFSKISGAAGAAAGVLGIVALAIQAVRMVWNEYNEAVNGSAELTYKMNDAMTNANAKSAAWTRTLQGSADTFIKFKGWINDIWQSLKNLTSMQFAQFVTKINGAFKSAKLSAQALWEALKLNFDKAGELIDEAGRAYAMALIEAKKIEVDYNNNLKETEEIQARINKAQEQYDKARVASITKIAKLDDEIKEQRMIAMDDENYSREQQLAAIEKAQELIKEKYAIETGVQKLYIELLELQGQLTDNTAEFNIQLAEAKAQLSKMYAAEKTEITALFRRRNALNKAESAEREKARKDAEKEAKTRQKAEEQAEKARTNATNKINEWTLATQSAQVAMMPSATRQQKIQKDIAQVSAWYEQQTTKLEKEFKAQEAALEKHGEDTSELLAAYINRWDALSEEFDYRMGNAERGGTQDSPLAKFFGVTDEEFEQIKSQALQFAQQLYSELEQQAKDSIQRRLDDELDALDRETESKKAALKKQADDGVISQKTYERRLSEIDKEAAAKQEELKKEAFEEQKKWNLANAAMNGALAITNLLATVPGGKLNPAFWVALVFTTMTTLAQTAMIASQKYARGGLLQGASHAQGGIKGSVQGNNIELEGGEVVINKRSSAMFRRELSAINSYNGWGQKFAAGGELPKRFKFAEGGQLPSFAPAPLPVGADTGGFAQAIDAMNKRNDQLERAIYAIERQVVNIRAHVVYDDIESTGNDIRVAVERTSL